MPLRLAVADDAGFLRRVLLEANDWNGEPRFTARCLPASAPGYGFVAADVPDVTVGLLPGHRGRGHDGSGPDRSGVTGRPGPSPFAP